MLFRRNQIAALAASAATLGAMLAISACQTSSPVSFDNPAATAALQRDVKNVVVIYAENRSFDNLYGRFPGANGVNAVLDASGNPTSAYVVQKDRDGSVLPKLPQTWGGVTAEGVSPAVTQAQSDNLPNAPFAIDTAFPSVNSSTVTRDLVHRFFENQMQINGGKNDMFAAWTDAGGLTMGHFAATSGNKMYQLAQQFVLADNFFQGAFGGSFLNHQYLICACSPSYPNADAPTGAQAGAAPSINVLDGSGPKLKLADASPASALDGPPAFVKSGAIAPKDYFGSGDGFRAVNTIQPPYQPSGNPPVDTTGNDALYAKPNANDTLPAQTQLNIGDLLTFKGVSWAWYAGAWNAALTDGKQDPATARSVIYAPETPQGSPDFQPHHQPFNYYANFDPVDHADARTAHLKDYNDLVGDAAAGTLPSVVFYKPQGNLNQHPGYANVSDGDNHIADLVAKLQAGPQWANMVIVITYDEFGGIWDHVAPPRGDLLGPGTRIPAIIVSPFARKGTVDHTQYDTASTLRLITHTFALPTLPGLNARDHALLGNGSRPMGDLSNALDLP